MDMALRGKSAVVTGASKGIGLAVTQTLLDEGMRVVAASRTRTPELESLDGDLIHAPADFMDPGAPEQVVDRAAAEFGGLDLLVNNVGGPPPGVDMPRSSFFDASDEEWRAMFELNLFSAVRASRAAIPMLLDRGGGSIINISSVHGRVPFPNVDYSAAKAALNNLTVSLSEEFAEQGIRVNTVSPGPVRTPWWTDEDGVADRIASEAGTDRETALSTVAPKAMRLSTGRLAEAQEIADMVALLASPRSGSTTGSEIVVDSGFVKSV
jgi:NAD(P)-dependent dehydrogenase (short-subunit alcohol dehydrogenase family)